MGREQAVRTLLTEIAQDAAPAGTIALGPGVRERAFEMQMQTDRINRRWRLALAVVAALALLSGLLMAVPTTRAAIDDLLRRLGFNLAPEEETNNTTVMLLEPTILPVTPVFLSVEDVQAGVAFQVRTPGWLPEGIAYRNGDALQTADKGIPETWLTYRRAGEGDAPDAPELVLEATTGDLPPIYLSEKAAQDVTVSRQPGVYIHGGWTTSRPIQPGESIQGLFWDFAEDDAYLSWVEDGIAYRIQQHGLGLTLEDMTRIAESLR